MDKFVTVSHNGKTLNVPLKAWEVMMASINWLVDSGDAFTLLGDDFTREEIQSAREISGEFTLIGFHR